MPTEDGLHERGWPVLRLCALPCDHGSPLALLFLRALGDGSGLSALSTTAGTGLRRLREARRRERRAPHNPVRVRAKHNPVRVRAKGDSSYSARTATTGSTLVARHIGTTHAMMATASNAAAPALKANGSARGTP